MKVILALFVLFCSGCAGIVIPLDQSAYTSPDAIKFEFVDLRPDGEKVLRPAKDGQPYHSYGDEQFAPDRMMLLKDAVMAKCGQKLTDHKVEISQFEFIAYIPGLLAKQKNVGKASAFGGLIGGIAVAVSEKKDMGDRFICSLEGSVDGKPIVVSDSEKIPGYIDLSPAKAAGNKLMQRIIENFVAKVETNI